MEYLKQQLEDLIIPFIMNGDKQALKKVLKKELPKLFKEIKEKTGKTRAEIAEYLGKQKEAVDKWAQGKSAPPFEEAKEIVSKLTKLLELSNIKGRSEDYVKNKLPLSIELRNFKITTPEELLSFWNKPYNDTFKLYNWGNTFSIIKPDEIKEETITLNKKYPEEKGVFLKAHKLLPFAKENELDRNYYLAYAFDNSGKPIGIYLWNINGHLEYPLFIANSISDLIDQHIITFEREDKLHFDSEAYLNETFEKYMKGYILPLNFKSYFDDSNEILTHFKKLVEFYETAFKEYNDGIIKFEPSGELINISIEKENTKRIAYNITEGDIYFFIEKINDGLNSIEASKFCRPDYFGYYLINKKYIACLRIDIATDLIQKGYINSRYKMLPMEVFYNPLLVERLFGGYPMETDLDKENNQKVTWIGIRRSGNTGY